MLPARWFDGLSSKPRPVMVVLQAGAKGPSLLLHPLNEPGAAPQVFTHAQVGWPEAWSDRRPQRRVVELGELDPEHIITPGIFVQHVVQVQPEPVAV